ncbi:hypothetical protein AKJ65_07610 [candidate division MSBL1 archaeon SCGC-AAA259E19]|uniref:Glycosyl hydrolase n=1 Tax=candidate division MSBL1 archaeon SCGC-AAA259E19 TaxID=1698264 RepID=A0A133UDX5_9EURY|nr:hypothetical protein AKJ65_07610 [candidate division MSBL1 archaeon SCGC-AAA259E19]
MAQNDGELKPLRSDEIKPKGWLKDHLNVDAKGYFPAMEGYLPSIKRSPFFTRYWNYSNDEEDPLWWEGEHTGYWIDGLTRLAFLTENEKLQQQVRDWLDKLLESQDENGYLGIFPKSYPQRWSDSCSELWPQTHIYQTLLAYYDYTNDRKIWNSLLQAASLTAEQYDNGRNWIQEPMGNTADFEEYKKGTNTHSILILEPMLELASRRDPDEKFFDFAINMFKENKAENAFLRDMWNRDLSGHGVHVIEHIRIPAMIYSYTGENEYLEVSKDCFNIIEEDYLNSSGAPKSDEWIDGGASSNKGCEYCAMVEWMLTANQLFAATGDSHYADVEESVVFNAAQGAREPSGRGVQYLSFPNQIEALKGDWHGEYAYRPNHYPACCPTTAGRMMPYFVERCWMKDPEGNELAACSYAPCRIDTELGAENKEVKVIIEVETDYPFDEKVLIKIESENPTEFGLRLRIPDWCENPKISVNGETKSFEKEDFANIHRTWREGDEVELTLPMKIRVKKDKDNLITVHRGPLIYSLNIPGEERYFDDVDCGYSGRGYVPKGEWRYALVLDEEKPTESFEVVKNDSLDNAYPWTSPPVKLKAEGLKIPEWGTTEGEGCPKELTAESREESEIPKYISRDTISGGKVPEIPESPIDPNGNTSEISLIPFGFTRLRITSFPVAYR